MTKVYDDKYSTKVAFNAPIMNAMLEKRDLSLVVHWLENGEPNKKLATQALQTLLLLQWNEALDLLWSVEWITKKSMINTAWKFITSPYGKTYQQPLKGTATEQWLINKTYNEKILSKNELNSLHLTLLDAMITSKNNYYWDMFFTPDIFLKGATSDGIFTGLLYFSNHDAYNSNSVKNVDFENLSKERLNRFLEHPNGFEIEPFSVLKVLLELENLELFWKIMNSKFIIENKKLFMLATIIGLYFKSTGQLVKKMSIEEVSTTLDKLMKIFVNAGLTEFVTFTKKDILEKFSHYFTNGYISLNSRKYLLGLAGVAGYLPYVYNSYSNEDKVTDVTFSTGVAFFTLPNKNKFGELKYKDLSLEEETVLKNKMKSYFK